MLLVAWALTSVAEPDVLAVHDTRARFAGVEERVCRGEAPPCPSGCEHGGKYALFEIVSYRSLETFAEPRAGKVRQMAVRVVGDLTVSAIVRDLAEGDVLRMVWRDEPDGTPSIVRLDKLRVGQQGPES
jgi:hypothetical protein